MLDQLTPQTAATTLDSAASYAPEPSSSGIGFQDVIDTVKNVAGEIGGVPLQASGSFEELIQAQIQAQVEMQTTSMISNIEKSKHETKMAPIRNIRVSS